VAVAVALVEPAQTQLATELPRPFIQMALHQLHVVETVELEKSPQFSLMLSLLLFLSVK
jgi:hypothetical protein